MNVKIYYKKLAVIGFALLILLAHVVLLSDFPLLWQAVAALLLAGWLPGMLLVEWLLGKGTRWERALYSIGASYTIMVVVMLFVSYLPGPVLRWQTFMAFDLVLGVLGVLSYRQTHQRVRGQEAMAGQASKPKQAWYSSSPPAAYYGLTMAGLLSLLLVGGFFRLTNLDYSEFQGDEARAALRAAAVIQGYEDVLFLHKKGPTEILLPTVIYSLTGRLNEQMARLPFALANLAGLFAIFLLGWRFFGPVAGWSAAILLALDGYFIGFARIVQYQSVVFLMSVLIVLLVHRLYPLSFRATNNNGGSDFAPRWRGDFPHTLGGLILAALFLATGLLSHYEAIFALLPATFLLIWSLVQQLRNQNDHPPLRTTQAWRTILALFRVLLLPILIGALILASFYIPFIQHPHFSETYQYITNQRIGGQLPYNNLRDFFLLTTLYSTTYYLVLMIGLVTIGMIVAYRRAFQNGWLLAIPIVLNLLFTAWEPEWLTIGESDYTVFFFALMLWPIILLPRLTPEARTIWLWFGLVSLLTLFFTNRPYTHVYVFFIPWALLSGMTIGEGWRGLQARVGSGTSIAISLPIALCAILLFGTYAYWYFVYNKVEILANWQTHRPRGFWTVYDQPLDTGIFGFPLKNGWKAIGVQYQEEQIKGIFDTNEIRNWTFAWYTRGQVFCQRDHDYYFLVDRLVPGYQGKRQTFAEQIEPDHQLVTSVLVNDKARLESYKKNDKPQAEELPLEAQRLDISQYEQRFDRQFSGSDFKLHYPTIEPTIQHPLRYRLGEHIWLEGYSLERDHVQANESLFLTLYWRSTAKIWTGYTVFNQILEPGVAMYGQLDAQPGCDKHTTDKWSVGELVEDQYRIPIFPDAKPGSYPLLIGMYQPDPFENLTVYDANGQPIGNSIELTHITVEPSP